MIYNVELYHYTTFIKANGNKQTLWFINRSNTERGEYWTESKSLTQ